MRLGTASVEANNPLSNIKSTDLIPNLSSSTDIYPLPPNLQPTYISKASVEQTILHLISCKIYRFSAQPLQLIFYPLPPSPQPTYIPTGMVRPGTASVKTNNPSSNIKSTDLIPNLSSSTAILPAPSKPPT